MQLEKEMSGLFWQLMAICLADTAVLVGAVVVIRFFVGRKIDERTQYEHVRTMVGVMLYKRSHELARLMFAMGKFGVFLVLIFVQSSVDRVRVVALPTWFLFGAVVVMHLYAVLNLNAMNEEEAREIFCREMKRPLMVEIKMTLVILAVVTVVIFCFNREIGLVGAGTLVNYAVTCGVVCVMIWLLLGGFGRLVDAVKTRLQDLLTILKPKAV